MDLTRSQMEVALQPLPGRGKYNSVGAKRVHVQGYAGLRWCISAGPVTLLMLVGVSGLSGVTGVGHVTASGVTGVGGATSAILSSRR